MNPQNKFLIVTGAGAILAAFLYWFSDRLLEPPLVSQASSNNATARSVQHGAGDATNESGGGVKHAQLDAASSNPNRFGVDSPTDLSWQKVLKIRDTRWAIEQLSISADPNERLRGYALSVMCTKTLLSPPDGYQAVFAERKITPLQQVAVTQMRDDMQSRCGASSTGNPYLPSAITRQGLLSARAAQVPLAIASDAVLSNVVKSGLTSADADALSIVLKDEALRSVWIAKSLTTGLGQELSASPKFQGIPAEEMTGALMAVLCRSGDDCGVDSVYRPYLCFTSGFRFCSGKTVSEAIEAGLGPENGARFEATVKQLQTAFAAGDLNALGFPRKNTP